MKKRTLFFFGCLILLLVSMCCPVLAESGFEASITTDRSGNLTHDQAEFIVTVTLDENPGYYAMILQFAFDSDVLELVSSTYDDRFGVIFTEDGASPVRISGQSEDTAELQILNKRENTSTGTVCTATFRLKNQASYYVHADVDVSFEVYTDQGGEFTGPDQTYEIVRNIDFTDLTGAHQEHMVICKHAQSLTFQNRIEPDCANTGVREHYFCSICEKCFSDETGSPESLLSDTTLPVSTVHKLVYRPAVLSTCTGSGTAAHYHCTVEDCQKNFSDEAGTRQLTSVAAPLAAHRPVLHEAVPADCVNDGSIEYHTCSVCRKYSKNGQTGWMSVLNTSVPALGHDTVLINQKNPTTSEEGYTGDEYCRRCEKTITYGTEIPKKNSIILPIVTNYRVTLELGYDAGSEIDSFRVRSGTGLNLDAFIPKREGWEFAGWYADEAFTKPVSGTVRITKNTRLYAAWLPLPPFHDVNAESAYYDDIKYVWRNDLMDGIGETEFAPDNVVPGIALIPQLYRLFGALKPDAVIPDSAEVRPVDWYTAILSWAAARKIAILTPSDPPKAPLTGGELLRVIRNYTGMFGYTLPTTPYEKQTVQSAAWSASARWAVETGLLDEKHPLVTKPESEITRAELAMILHRLYDKLSALSIPAAAKTDGLE